MAALKDYLIGEIENLERQTGYDFDFLMDTWNSVSSEGTDFDEFKQITLELDW